VRYIRNFSSFSWMISTIVIIIFKVPVCSLIISLPLSKPASMLKRLKQAAIEESLILIIAEIAMLL